MTDSANHWEQVYQQKKPTQLSWYQPRPTLSYDWILAYVDRANAIIDVGCGMSVLADNLLDEGYADISLLEISSTAMEATKQRLAKHKNKVNFYNTNILDFNPNKTFKLWHDRAVFHFLTQTKAQKTYLFKLNQFLDKGGFFLLATFAKNGPKKCSGLEVVQYDEAKIGKMLGKHFKLIKTSYEIHPHPGGGTQSFGYFLLQKN